MLRRIINYFRKPEEEDKVIKEVQLSKIDKYVNLILRHSVASNNKVISDTLQELEQKKESIMQQLHHFHKKTLMNPNIPQREIQIMDGNRDNFIKLISHFIAGIMPPKNYMELYDYCVSFPKSIEQTYKDLQKSKFILSNFFSNEIKSINSDINRIEQIISNIKDIFERHKIQELKEIMGDVKKITDNMLKISNLESEVEENKISIKDYQDKIKKLEERIKTITSGTDYRALEDFKEEKQKVQDEIIKTFNPLEEKMVSIDHTLRKYFYKNPDKKILKEYFEDRHKTFINDEKLEIAAIIEDLKNSINNDSIELRDKKKEQIIEMVDSLSTGYLKETQSQLKKLEDTKQHLQTKITHNSASLNLSEQQYWINTNKEKITDHEKIVEKLNNEIARINSINNSIKNSMKEDIEKLLMEDIHLIDDLSVNNNEVV